MNYSEDTPTTPRPILPSTGKEDTTNQAANSTDTQRSEGEEDDTTIRQVKEDTELVDEINEEVEQAHTATKSSDSNATEIASEEHPDNVTSKEMQDNAISKEETNTPPDDTKATTEEEVVPAPPAEQADSIAEPDAAATIAVIPAESPAPVEQTVAPVAPANPFMGIEDLLALRIASDPQISPDGSLIAFSVLHCNADKNTTSSAIWLVSSTGGKTRPPWQITSGEQHDTTPRWSPDGRTLAFLSDRTGTTQIFLLSMSGGEARQLSFLSQGVTEYSWRPDGRVLLAHSPWKPIDDQKPDNTDDTAEIFTRIDAQWNGKGYNQGRHQQLWLVPLEGAVIRLTSEPVDLVQSCWSPDGNEIAFCSNRRLDPDLSVSMALWILTVATGKLRRLTPQEGLAQMPSWSPDGQFIAYLYAADQTEAGNIAPWLVSAQGGSIPRPAVPEAEAMTCQVWIIDELRDEYLAPPQWYPDSKAILVPVQERGQVHLYRLDIIQGTHTKLTSGNGRYISPQISRNGQSIALLRADWFTPGDIWSMDGTGKRLQKLSRVNDAFLQSRQLIRPRRITWQGAEGLEIEGWLYLPPLGTNTAAPLIVAPHGGPSNAWGDGYVHEFQVLAGRGYAVLAPNPRGSAGYGDAFSRQILNDWGGKDFHDLMAGIAHVIATEPVHENRIGIGGLSYGGYMTNWTITQTNIFKAAVSRNGVSSIVSAAALSDQTLWFGLSIGDKDLQIARSPLTFAERISTPLLLLDAEDDLRCPFSESLQLFVALRKRKQMVELVRYPNVSHLQDWPTVGTPSQRVDRLRRTVEWFEHFV